MLAILCSDIVDSPSMFKKFYNETGHKAIQATY